MNESKVLNKDNNIEITITKKISKTIYLAIKRIFDIMCATLGFIIASPIFIIVGIAIRIEDGHSPILVQKRIGKHGKEFKFYKFRSMVPHADEILMEMLKDPKTKQEYDINKKLDHDPRITKVGQFIRKTSIDELPQLINIIKGDMSFIGNRPYLPREKNDMGSYFDEIVKTKPGLTGYWQTSGRSDVTFQNRLKLESYYSNHANIKMDIKIFFKTFTVVFKRKGAE